MSERESIEQALIALEQQRSSLGDAAVDAALAGLRQRLAEVDGAEGRVAPDLAGERKLVTVMFADISGFTALSEKLDPEQVRAITNACFTALVPVVEKYGGVIDKFIGDEIMALFGAPAAHDNDAERALRAGLEMMETLDVFNMQHGTRLGMHFGLNTGTVVAGGLGSDGRQQYSVMGDTVNLAARLEDAAESGQILVGCATHRLTAPLFEFEDLPPMRLKGKAGLVAVHRLIGVKAVPGSVHGITGLHSPLVGRDAELEHLVEGVRSLSSGAGRVIAVIGDPGLGKSRLVAEVRQALTGETQWAEGRALSFGRAMSYAVVQSMLANLLGVLPGTAPTEVGAALRSTIENLLPERCDELYPYLARLLDLPLDPASEEQLKHVLPEAMKQRIQRAFADLVLALCALQPVVLVWEDLHWADPSSLSLLESLMPLADQAPMLLLLVFRPNEGSIQTWYQDQVAPGQHGREMLELVPLTNEESEQLIENLLRIESMPEPTRELILSKAEGNPFFLEELLRSLIDTGMVLMEGDRVIAARAIEQLEIPDTVQGVVAARIDRLPPGDKRTLQNASVIGRVFQRPVLAYLFEREPADVHLDERLGDLQRRELIRPRQTQLEYIFKHAVTQDVTYHSLLLTRRKELHQVTAEAIEALFPDQLEELCETLAYHYQKAEAADQAIRYLLLAAERARSTYSNTEAIGFYRAALEQAGDRFPEQTAQLQESLGDVLALTGKGQEARDAYADALARIPERERVWQSRLHRKSGTTWVNVQQPDKAPPFFAAAETALGPQPTTLDAAWLGEWLEIQLDLAWAYYWQAKSELLDELTTRIRPVVEERGTPFQRARLFGTLAQCAWRRERYVTSEETLGHLETAVAAARESGDQKEIARQTTGLGMCHLFRGELRDAELHLQTAARLAEQIGDLLGLIMSLTYLTVTYRRLRDVKAVRQLAARCIQAAGAGKMDFYVGSAEANLAWAAWFEGRRVEARQSGVEALSHWGQSAGPVIWLALWPLLAIARSEGKDCEAIDCAHTLVAPPVMRMPPALEGALLEAIGAWDRGEEKKVPELLNYCLELAQKTGWL